MSRSIVAVMLLTPLMICSDTLRAVEKARGGSVVAKSPAESLRCLQVPEGCKVELVAAEPLVIDPIAIAWGADARLWVVEMGGYPSSETSGRVRFLEDSNRDGQYDRSTVFLDGLSFPTGVLPWREGVLITSAPDILYAEDSDGDGKADIREVLFCGFGRGNPQHRVNGLRWGLDNWVHCSNGDSGGLVRSLATGEQIAILGHDVRVCPRRGLVERLAGMSQFGRCRDDWGNWFGCNSLRPFWHVVLEDRYLRRNPFLRSPEPIQHLIPPTGTRVFPVNRDLPRYNEPHLANRFTSACGVAVYRDRLFGGALDGSFFVCEPAHNLVRREVMFRDGISFGSRSTAEEQQEFLASSDPWFRPTQIRTGPDGAVWCVDMYRAVIEHPEYLSDHGELPLRDGSRRGRIYRVVPEHEQLRAVPRLAGVGARALAAHLATPNGPVRDMVQQVLVESQDQSAVESLELLVLNDDRATVRVGALCTLDGLDGLQPSVLAAALADTHPAVRRHAVRISESMLPRSHVLQSALLKLVGDSDSQVVLQLACSLGEWRDSRAGQALARIAVANDGDQFIAAAVVSSAAHHTLAMLQAALEQGMGRRAVRTTKTLMQYALWDNQEEAIALVLRRTGNQEGSRYENWQLDVLATFLDALRYQGSSLVDLRSHTSNSGLRLAIDQLEPLFDSARSMAFDETCPAARRVLAVRVLCIAKGQQKPDSSLAGLLRPQSPAAVQEAVVDKLLQSGCEWVPGLLLERWRSLSPPIRMQVVDGLVSRAEWAAALLDHIESRHIPFNVISTVHRGQLLLHNNPALGRRTAQLFRESRVPREEVIERYVTAVQGSPSNASGQRLFRTHCSSCHRFEGVGGEIGPDLSTIQDRSIRRLVTDLIDPSGLIEPRYVTYLAETVDGRVYSGILHSSSGNSITLVSGETKKRELLRSELARLESTERSLMPEDWDRLLSDQDIADLIAYLRRAEISRSH